MPGLFRLTPADIADLPDDKPREDDPREMQRVLQGNFVLELKSSDQRSGTFAGLQLTGPIYVGEEEDPKAVNARIDFYQGLIRRQQWLAQIDQMEALNVSEVASLESLAEHIAGLAEQTKAGRKLATTQKMQVENYDQEVTKRKQLIVQRQAEIAALKKKAGIA